MSETQEQYKPGFLAKALFVIFLGTWIAVFRVFLAPSLPANPDGSYTMFTLVIAAVGGGILAPIGMAIGVTVERSRQK